MSATILHKKLEKIGSSAQSEKETYKHWQKAYKGILKYHKNLEMATPEGHRSNVGRKFIREF